MLLSAPPRSDKGTAIVIPNLLNDPLFEYVDNVSWSKGKHAFKFGGDVRFPKTDGYAFQPYVNAPFGNLGGPATQSPFVTETAGTGTPTLGATVLPAGSTYAANPSIMRATTRTKSTRFGRLPRTLS